ncbi:MAG: DUF1987 domain-containing protein [Bacteroidia bacterium]
MEALRIESTHKTPRVVFDPENNIFEISGRSIPEDAVGFYKPLFDWLEEYAKNPLPRTHIKFELEYFNTSSSKNILELLKVLERIHNEGHEILVTWYYDEDDEDMEETGQDYQALLNLPIELSTKVH